MNFAIIGVGGYIAPRHLEAIKSVGGQLVAAMDINDSVGVLDRYFDEVPFFTKFELFECYLEELKTQGIRIDYLSVCSPNDMHLSHILFGLRQGANIICEKPLVLNIKDVDLLIKAERIYLKKVFTILQLRVHSKLIELKHKIDIEIAEGKKFKVSLQYVTTRGPWYFTSWKGDTNRSGGIASNIGIHFFDLLCWLYGETIKIELLEFEKDRQVGRLYFNNAEVNWSLSVNKIDLPQSFVQSEKKTFRSIKINEVEVEFSEGFTELHSLLYKNIVAGNGNGILDSKPAICIVEEIRRLSLGGSIY